MNCLSCGAPIPSGAPVCRKCGAAVGFGSQAAIQAGGPPRPQAPVNVIIQMGPATAGAAPGGQMMPQPVAAAPRSKIAAGLLGIFLGFFGVHRFYLGYTGLGLAQLLITVLTCGYGLLITAPWGIIEGILILVGTIDRDAWGRPLSG